MTNPSFLFLEIAGEFANQVRLMESLRSMVQSCGGDCHAHAAPGRATGLEPGTVSAGLLIAKFKEHAALLDAVRDVLLPYLFLHLPGTTPLVLAVEGLPEQGLPEMMDVPTVASVPVPPRQPRNTFLVVRGIATDTQRMDEYRDVILPMHKERGGYYEVFALNPDQVTALSGRWTQQIFAISRWPSRAAAEDFWFCDRYQQQAIPLRLGAGQFTVHLLEASADS